MIIDKIKNLFKKTNKEKDEEVKAPPVNAEFGFDNDDAINEETAENADLLPDTQAEYAEDSAVMVVDAIEKSGKKEKRDGKTQAIDDFSRLAEILNKDKKTVIEECKLFQIRNIMGYLSKAVVRRGLPDGKIKILINNACVSGLNEIAVAPAYLKSFAAQDVEKTKVCAVVDFPFGEASFKVKFSEIKNCVKAGVDGVLTVVNSAALLKDSQIELKKQLKKIGRIKGVEKVEKGVAVNAEDVSVDDIKRLFRIVEKSGIGYAAFLFGSVSQKELLEKMKEINKFRGETRVKVMANVENVNGVKTLIALGADGIITPYADAVAKELFKEFGVKSVKLL